VTTPFEKASWLARGRRRTSIGMAVGVLTLVLAGFSAGVAQASTTWGSTHAIDTNGAPLLSVACPSTSQCTTVDFGGQEVTFNPATGAAINGGPVNVDGVNLLRAVACASTTLCTGVDDHGLAVSFNPQNGSVPAGGGPLLIDPLNTFYGVSCAPSQTVQCVGLDRNGHEVTFNPGNLSSHNQHTIDLGHATERLSCFSTTQCTAVDDSGQAITFDPTTGIVSPAAGVIDATINHQLYVVSCPLATQCTAIDNGGNEITFDPQNLVTPAPIVANIDNTALYSVACADATHCTAVDNHGYQLSFNPTLATPTVTKTQPDTTGNGALHGLSCPSVLQCTAVDNGGNQVTFATPGGGVTSGANLVAAGNALPSVSCSSVAQCTAVDVGGQATTFDPQNNAVISAPHLLDTATGVFLGVSCPSASLCTAVTWDGRGFSWNPTSPPGSSSLGYTLDSGALFGGVSCVSSTQCTAVDFNGNEVTYDPTAMTVTHTGLVDTAMPVTYLQAVSCPSAGQCTAVDFLGNEMTFNPTSGALLVPEVAISGNSLNGVSCPSTTQCTAVDGNGNQITFNPQTSSGAQTHNIDNSLVPLNALYSVSCPTTGLCLAADGGGNAVEFNPNSSGATVEAISGAGPLEAIVCTSAQQCVVVDNAGNEAQGTNPVPPPAVPVDQTVPTISGMAQQGQVLTEAHGGWTNSPTGYAYQWQRCNSAGASCVAIAGATGQTYTLGAADVGSTIVVAETASNIGGNAASAASSAATAVVAGPPSTLPAASAPPTISGKTQVGQTLTEAHGTWSNSPTGYAYLWQRCDTSGANCQTIPGATAQTYTLAAADTGHTIRVTETASNTSGAGSPATSGATVVVKAKAPNTKLLTELISSKSHRATFTFKATGRATGFQCALVLKPTRKHAKVPAPRYVSCGSSKTYTQLKPGTYVFYVRAVGAGGHDTTPVVISFTITPAPKPVAGHVTAKQVTSAVNKILATSPATSRKQYDAVKCQAIGHTVFRGHLGSLWKCAITSKLAIGGTTFYAVVVRFTVYLVSTRPCQTNTAGQCVRKAPLRALATPAPAPLADYPARPAEGLRAVALRRRLFRDP